MRIEVYLISIHLIHNHNPFQFIYNYKINIVISLIFVFGYINTCFIRYSLLYLFFLLTEPNNLQLLTTD